MKEYPNHVQIKWAQFEDVLRKKPKLLHSFFYKWADLGSKFSVQIYRQLYSVILKIKRKNIFLFLFILFPFNFGSFLHEIQPNTIAGYL